MKVTKIDLETFELSFDAKDAEKLKILSRKAEKSEVEFIMFLLKLGLKLIQSSNR